MTVRIIRARRRHRYAQIDMAAIEDVRLSWAARGLLIYLLSRPDDWRVIANHLVRQGDLGRDGIYKLLEQLRELGYVQFFRRRNRQGRFVGADYYIRETLDLPYPGSPSPDSPDVDEPEAESPQAASPDRATPEISPTTDPYLEDTTPTTTNHTKRHGGRRSSRNSIPIPNLVLPADLSPEDCEGALRIVGQLPPVLAQQVLDELAGIMHVGAIRVSPLACLTGIVHRVAEGTFEPDLGPFMQESRDRAEDSHD